MSIAPTLPVYQAPPQDTKAPEVPFNFKDELEVFRALDSDYADEIQATQVRRELREHKKNVGELRAQGLLLPDETIVPDRTIEQNCQLEIIPYINYTEQATDVISFTDPANPSYDFSRHANWITSLLRYENWQVPWQEMQDCMVLHGAGFHEVVFSEATPAKFEIEYVRRDHLRIPQGTIDINACYRVARCYELTKHQLDLLAAAYAFNESVVQKIKDHYKSKTDFIKIFKYFLRDENNYVYNAWFADPSIAADDWLRPPEKHFLGDFDLETTLDEAGQPTQIPVPAPTTIIPIFGFPYRVQEDQKLLKVQGQAALSVHIQNALTGIYSGVTNGCQRASGVYAAATPAPGEGTSDKTLFFLKPGYVHQGDIRFFSPPWPNAIALSTAQALGVRSASQHGNTDFAAMSRNDTAKRATEIVAAQEESNRIKTARISLYSNRCLSEYRVIFKLILNQIKIGAILPPEDLDVSVLFSPTLTLAMAADTQVVKREQRKQKLADFWPVIAPTPLAPIYLESMLQELFPEEWPIWKAAMQQQQQAQNAPNPLAVLETIYPQLTPEQQQYVQQQLNPAGGPDVTGGQPPNVAGGPGDAGVNPMG